MRLKSKLFLSASLLFLFLGISFYLFFLIFLSNGLGQTTSKIRLLFEKQDKDEQQIEMLILKQRIEDEKENINALLPFLAPSLQGQESVGWNFLSSFLASHPNLGLIQIRDTNKKIVRSLIPSEVPLYSVTTFAMNDHFFFVLLPSHEKEKEEENLFIAFPSPTSGKELFPSYLLFPWTDVGNEVKEVFGTIEKEPLNSFPFHPPLETEKEEIEKLTMIKTLAPFYEDGVFLFHDQNKKIPAGLAYLSPDGKGKAILAKDVFNMTSFFDDEKYYESNRPPASYLIPADGTAFIFRNNEMYVGNTFSFDSYLLTLAFPLSPFAKELAIVSHRDTLITSKGGSMGFSSFGKKIDQGKILELTSFLESQKESGESSTSFSRLSLLPSDNVNLYLFAASIGKKEIFSTFDNLNHSLSKKIAYEMLILIVIALIIALFILNRVATRISKPIVELAGITNAIKEGKYKEIVYPDVGNRQDEVAILTRSFQDMVVGLQEKEKIRTLLNKVVSKDIAEEILKNDVHLGGEDRIISILFADIRNFTEITSQFPPQKTVNILNMVMTMVSRIIEGEGGVIDKYVGDEVMALYGAPIACADHALRALSSAKLIIETLRKWNKDRESSGEIPIELGIGINTGLVVAGNMGAEDRLNYTVIGPSVNLASRLCTAALAMQTLISEFTLEEPGIRESFYVESLPMITLKGFAQPVKIYQVIGFKWEGA